MSYSAFTKLHQDKELLLLGNVWDAQSSKLAQEVGFKALGLSSHAIANVYGYEDGEIIKPAEILYMVEHIMKVIDVPLSVDFESGYSDDPDQVAEYVKQLQDVGVVGINIEDGKVINGKRQLGDSNLLAKKIQAIKQAAPEIFINARADTYTTKHPSALEETIKRAEVYAEAGAHGLFIPLVEKEEDLRAIAQSTSLYFNVFLTPNLPTKDKLVELGVTRVSHGPLVWEYLIKKSKQALENIFTSMNALE